MTKTKKQEHPTPAEIKNALNQEAEQAVDKACAEEIEQVLKKHGRALQPFFQRTEMADIARVRLVKADAKEEEAKAE